LRWQVIAYCFALLAGAVCRAPAQERLLNLVRYGQNHNIPEGRINCMVKDDLGMLWLGTEEGLYSFDGKRCEKYERPGSDLIDADITSLLCDHQGWLWAGTQADGLLVFDLRRDTMLHFEPGASSGIPNNRIKYVVEDHKQRIWVATHISGLNLFDRENLTFSNYRPSDGYPDLESRDLDEFTSIETDPRDQNIMWIGSLSGLLRFEIDIKIFTLIPCTKTNVINPEQFNGFENKIRDVYHDGEYVWFSSFGGGLTRFNPVSAQFKTYKFEQIYPPSTGHNNLKHIIPLSDDILLLIAYNNPIVSLNRSLDSLELIDTPHFYSSYLEENGALWLSTSGALYLYNPRAQFITKVNLDQDVETVFPKPSTDLVYAAHWTNELVELDESDYSSIIYEFNPLHSSDRNIIQSINFAIRPFPILVGAYDLYALNTDRSKIDLFRNLGVVDEGFLSIQWVRDRYLWLGNKQGLYCIDIEAGTQIKYTKNDGLVHDAWINDLHLDKQGNIWYATEQGFGSVDQQCRPVFSYPYDPASASDTAGALKSISAIVSDDTGCIWVGDHNQGIAVFEGSQTTFTEIRRINRRNSALISDQVQDMVLDLDGDIWVTTPKGISRIRPADFSVENYGPEYGFDRLFQMTVSQKGEIYIGGLHGYHRFDPEEATPDTSKPQVILQSLSIYDQPYRGQESILYLNDLKLHHGDGFFTIGFTALNYFNSEPLEYQYKMAGLQDQWISNGDRQYVGFTKLAGGDYTFMVRARIGKWPWSESRILHVRIVPAFWQTTWFYLLMFLLVTIGVFAFYRSRMAQVRREEQYKASFDKKLAQTEMAALRAQMNPHFLFNCLNSIKLFTIENNTEHASKYLTKFSRLIRLILQNSQSAKVRLAEELEALQLYTEMEAMRFEEKFTFNIEIDNVPVNSVTIPPLVLQPYVENAIWHGLMNKEGGDGHLSISLTLDQGFLVCVIEDNGIGIAAAEKMKSKSPKRKKSYGMTITRDRLKLIKTLYGVDAEIVVKDLHQNGEAAGTRVTIRIPAMYVESGLSGQENER
jgi:ligand-binding sensor domain-containing protein